MPVPEESVSEHVLLVIEAMGGDAEKGIIEIIRNCGGAFFNWLGRVGLRSTGLRLAGVRDETESQKMEPR
jgi:hypothetical protein